MMSSEVFLVVGYSFFCRVSGFGCLFFWGLGSRESGIRFFCFGSRESGVQLLISGAVAAGVIAASPEGLSLFGAFLYHAL